MQNLYMFSNLTFMVMFSKDIIYGMSTLTTTYFEHFKYHEMYLQT